MHHFQTIAHLYYFHPSETPTKNPTDHSLFPTEIPSDVTSSPSIPPTLNPTPSPSHYPTHSGDTAITSYFSMIGYRPPDAKIYIHRRCNPHTHLWINCCPKDVTTQSFLLKIHEFTGELSKRLQYIFKDVDKITSDIEMKQMKTLTNEGRCLERQYDESDDMFKCLPNDDSVCEKLFMDERRRLFEEQQMSFDWLEMNLAVQYIADDPVIPETDITQSIIYVKYDTLDNIITIKEDNITFIETTKSVSSDSPTQKPSISPTKRPTFDNDAWVYKMVSSSPTGQTDAPTESDIKWTKHDLTWSDWLLFALRIFILWVIFMVVIYGVFACRLIWRFKYSKRKRKTYERVDDENDDEELVFDESDDESNTSAKLFENDAKSDHESSL